MTGWTKSQETFFLDWRLYQESSASVYGSTTSLAIYMTQLGLRAVINFTSSLCTDHSVPCFLKLWDAYASPFALWRCHPVLIIRSLKKMVNPSSVVQKVYRIYHPSLIGNNLPVANPQKQFCGCYLPVTKKKWDASTTEKPRHRPGEATDWWCPQIWVFWKHFPKSLSELLGICGLIFYAYPRSFSSMCQWPWFIRLRGAHSPPPTSK